MPLQKSSDKNKCPSKELKATKEEFYLMIQTDELIKENLCLKSLVSD